MDRVTNKKGFTVIELIVVIVSLLVILAIISKGFGRMYRWYQKAQTSRNLMAIRAGITSYYAAQAYDVDSVSSAVFTVKDISGSVQIANNTLLSKNQTAVSKLSNTFISLPVKDIEFDAFGTPYKFYVSKRLGSGNIQYRNIVVVSAGPNKKYETTFNSNTGQITVGGDDMVAIITGGDIEYQKYQNTIRKMEKYVRYLEDSFSIAYASDPSRNVSIDHFINRRRNGNVDSYVDPTDGFNNTCLIDSVTCLARPDQLGITLSANSSIEDESNDWYYSNISSPSATYIYIDDDSNNVRSPDSNSPPPYSAHVVTNTPWGTQIVLTALGSIS